MNKMDLKGTGVKSSGCDILGIDLGTTNSAVSVFNAGTVPVLLPVGHNGKYTVPSCVRWDGGDNFTVGAEAYKERYKPNVIYSVKRMMGSGDKITLVHEDGKTKKMTPAEVSAKILRHLADKAAEFHTAVDKCVITVPAYFDQRQITDTVKAAELAGLNCLQILKEPTSASFIYSLLGYANNGAVLIYDLGGGTFDATHMTFLRKDAVPKKMATSLKKQYGIEINSDSDDVTDQYYSRVIGTYGDMRLGGDDIDKLFGDTCLERQGIKLSAAGREQLYLRCESFKKNAAAAAEDVVIDGKKIHISRTVLEECVDKIFDRTMRIIEDVDMSEVSTIVLVGGSTKSQRIRDNLSSAFPGIEISAVLDPDETVALGAGAVAKAISGKKELEYSDVLPLPIGVLVDEKSVEVCLQKNTSMPYSVTRSYYTMHDYQERITVHLYQGLSSLPENCTYLGRITVDGIPKKPAGDVCVLLSFILNSQGRLRVVSRVEDIDREEELIIDNIFSVTGDEGKSETAASDFITIDDFEYMVVNAVGVPDAELISMMEKRRALREDSDARVALENDIFAKVFG